MRLTAAKRNSLPKSSFALPGSRRFPVNDAGHAKAAKSRASQAFNSGKISAGTKAIIDAKANRKLGKSKRKSAPAMVSGY
jgi:hypothetical protein